MAWAAALAVLTFVTFAPALRNDFVAFDDIPEIVARPDYNPPALSNLGHYWTAPYPDLYTPVLWTIWGLLAFVARSQDSTGVHWDAFPYHLFNVAAHVGAAVMAFLVLRRLVRSSRAAFFGAALFALHPIQVEAVAWVSGMKTPLSGLFALWATWHYLRFSELRIESTEPRNSTRVWTHYTAAVLVFLLAMITKPTVVVLPLILGAIEWLIHKRRMVGIIASLAPWLVLGILFGIINKNAQPAEQVLHPTLLQRVGISLHSLSFYLWKFFVPFPLLPDYSHTPQWLVHDKFLWVGAVPAILVLVVALALARRFPWVAVGVATFALGGVTTLGIIPYDYQIYSTVADRYIYLGILGPALIAAWLLRDREPTTRREAASVNKRLRMTTAIASVILVVCGVLSLVQCTRWADTQTLFTYTLRHNPDSLVAYRSLVLDAAQKQRLADLVAVTREGLAHRPHDPFLLQWDGNIALAQHRVDDAISAFQQAVNADARGADKLNALGAAYAQAGRVAEAEEAWKKATQGESRDHADNAQAYENLGILAYRQGRWGDAVDCFQQALQLDPNLQKSKAVLPQALARRAAATAAAAQSRPTSGPVR